MQWNTSTSSPSSRSPNNINTHEGGSHLSGFKAALTGTLNKYARDKEPAEGQGGEPRGRGRARRARRGHLIKLRDPQFEGRRRRSSEIRGSRVWSSRPVNAKLAEYLEENPTDARQVIQKAIAARTRARLPRRRAS
jgi:DNA gyrase subunit B